MTLLNEILQHNQSFVENKEYEKFQTDKFPDKRMVILSCMDTRLVELLPKSMNIRNGDVKIIKTAGAIVSHPFGSVMRSIIVAIYELNADEVFVIGHHDCGMSSVNVESVMDKMKDRNIDEHTISIIENSGIRIKNWLRGFDDVVESVKNSVEIIRNHPLIPEDVFVHGLVISPDTGKLDLVTNGYEVNKNERDI
ncbi:beta-class carbonic anhydrase [Peribacillus tepidiphilus]|uniref:beta-class carbonic anhydrase n=1 Tax=Peribacillus tepidiphilus TaxID=2652445 RepID=UPI0012912A6E|nr:carbonic anhydrase [Peribacillus tepidiphilus]